MIWHIVEVWLMVVLTFVLGCLAGAHLYGLIAGSRLAPAQGVVADAVGDIIDRIKARLGLAPTWRPVHLRGVERPALTPPGPETVPHEGMASGTVAAALPVAHRGGPTGNLPASSSVRRRRTPALSRLRPAEQSVLPLPPPVARVPEIVPMRPSGIAAPRGGVPDNLQRIKGIGKRNERMLNDIGIFHFGQVAAWTPAEVAWIGQSLAFPERIARDDWVGQATLLAMGSETGFQKSAERRRERRRQQRDFQVRMATASGAYDVFPDAPDDDDYDDEQALPVEGAVDPETGEEIAVEDLFAPDEDESETAPDAPDEEPPESTR